MRVSSTPTPVGDPLLVVPRRGQAVMMSSLIFLIAPAIDFADHAAGARLVAGLLVLAAFAALYTGVMIQIGTWPGRPASEDAQDRLIAEHPDQAGAHVQDIEAVSRRALAEVREAVAGYRRPMLSDELAGARSTLVAAGIAVESDGLPVSQLPPAIEMPGGDGLAAAAEPAGALPHVRAVILTTFGRPGYLRRAMESGAMGFVLKDAPASEPASAIRHVMAGERVLDPALAAAALADGESPLTTRDTEVLGAARGGEPVVDLAGRLRLSAGTVRNYLSSAMQKLGAHSRAEAVKVAEDKGWL